MATLTVENFRGGENLTEPTTLEDNQFELLSNFFYNDSKRPQTRRGYVTFGQPVPDSAILINACDATTNFAVASDAANLATGTAIRGSNSVSFDIVVATSVDNFAILSNSTLGAADISTRKGYLAFWIKPPAAFNTDLTNVQVRLGTDSSNYYEWTLGTLTEAANNFVTLLYSAATTTGTVTDTNINYFRLIVNYTGSYTDKTGVLIDAIYSYSATSTKSVPSIFFFQRDDTNATTLLANAGTVMFKYDETSTYWEAINTGLTEFETATGRTTEKTRWDFAVYKNIIYMCNGIDSYRSWNGTTVTTYGSQPKPRYLRFLGDRVFGFGADANPITLYYTNAAAADAATLDANTVVVGGDELGRGTGLFELGNIIMAGKSKKIFAVNVTTPSAVPIDARNGLYSHRATANVGNAILHFSDQGIDSLQQREGVSGSAAIEGEPMTANLQPLINQVDEKQYNANCGNYILPLKNYYFSFDTNADNIPDKTAVYSALVSGSEGPVWSEYTYPLIYQYGTYIDLSFQIHYLMATANGGQLFEIETGFNDADQAIRHELLTKAWDFGSPSVWKDFQTVDIYGLASEGAEIEIEIFVDDESVGTATVDSTFIDTTATSTPIGVSPIGVSVLGGGIESNAEIDLFPFLIRIPMFTGGQKIQVGMNSETINTAWTLDRMSISYDNNTFDLFPTANIA